MDQAPFDFSNIKWGRRTIMSDKETVFVVDDDAAIRDSLSWLISSAGMDVETYGSAQEFLDALKPDSFGCVVLDVFMPGMSGLELQERLAAENATLQIIIITGYGDISMAVQAVKAQAFDFLEKPFDDDVLLGRIQEALGKAKETRRRRERRAEIASRLAMLTPRERDVLRLVVSGRLNKVIGAQLGISSRTVEVHRAHVMEKLKIRNVPELVRLGNQSGLF